ncbi:MAG: sugar transferase [Alphaproteobacteria bacterium]
MLVHLPRSKNGASLRAQAVQAGEEVTQFEAALRRDLAAGPVLAYEPMLGGLRKQVCDTALVLLTAPLWALVLAILAAFAKARHRAPVITRTPHIGYGKKIFRRWKLRFAPPSAAIVPLHPPVEAANDPTPNSVGWRELLTRLPELINVLMGEMSLVGPRPLSDEELDELTMVGKKFYMSVRPGVFSLSDVEPDAPVWALCKYYALSSWSLEFDAQIAWESLSNAVRKRN